jgi:fructuronate reductase
LQADHPDITHDLANPRSPRSTIGYVAEALNRRRHAGTAPFTLLSCDNLPSNGATLHKIITEFASLREPAFGRYVADTVASPSTMVDRIVPATTDADRKSIGIRLGVEDAWPVVTDPFHQWVIEDRFPTGRPAWERSGAELVSDVAPFEHMKLRMLNGAHSVIASIGQITGLATVCDAVRQPVIRRFLQDYWAEIIPTVLADLQPFDYAARLLVRFDNAALQHRTAQIATDGSQKIPHRILASLRELRGERAPTPCLVIAVAAWIRSCAGFDELGRPLQPNDPLLQNWPGRPDQASASPAEIVRAFLGFAPVFGDDLVRAPDFADALEAVLTSFRQAGVIRTLKRLQHMNSSQDCGSGPAA